RFAGKIERDVHGNCIAVLQPEKTPKIMLAGHIDEIGYMVKYIDEQGYLYFSPVGGIDLHLLPGQRVWVKTAHGKVLGVIGKKPIHVLEEEERRKVVKIDQLWIDIGAGSESEAKKIVEIGDVAVPAVGFETLLGDMVIGRGFDDKAGAFVVGETLRLLSREALQASVYAVATVQEEIGLRGAQTSAYGIAPDIGIAVDVTFATDFPGMDKKKIGDIKLGKGPVIARGPNINPKVFELLIAAAQAENIPYQVEGVSRGTGTDANIIQLTKAGVATGLVSIPLRYMHTPVEMINLQDMDNTVRLLRAFVVRYAGQAMFSV
ncbi:MAG: M42 family metallopeptidase, partial [Candidatus Omnitrophica bacterium]|nr:M42 family metallopeptidase [Candidatus Omnitrophota bacterium]